ncbi:MAG: transglycosylase SLT domain-containing protein [Candidatus Competibacter denitrificans]
MTEKFVPLRPHWRAWRNNPATRRLRSRSASPFNWFRGTFMAGVLLATASCVTEPPRNVNNACAIFAEYRDWFTHSNAASRRWNVPLPVLLAIMHQESAFRADAKPSRRWYLGFIPGPRPSSASGYSQALDGTWERYRIATGNRGADRDEFADAVDFMGWYIDQTARQNRIARHDAYNQYLAYHEGQDGFAKGSYRSKTWLMERAHRVRQQAERYRSQLTRCYPQAVTTL